MPLPPRCPHAFARCTEVPELAPRQSGAPGHLDRCWLDRTEADAAAGRQPDRPAQRGDGDLMTVSGQPASAGTAPRASRAAARGRAPQGPLPDRGRDRVDRTDRPRARGRRRVIRAARGRDARDRGRVRMREDHSDPRARGSSTRPAARSLPRHRHHQGRAQGAAPHPAPGADGLPGPAGLAQPAQAGGPDPVDAAADRAASRGTESRPRSGRCSSAWASIRSTATASRMSSRAVSVSGSGSRARSRSSRS